jgi:xanthine dehydrogenase accessory factor
MFDIATEVLAELNAGRAVGVVVVTAVHGSAPRTPGAAMAVTEDGRVIGSLSGGCVESEAYELAARVLASGDVVTETLGADGDFYRAALSCGGALDVVAERITPGSGYEAALKSAIAGEAAALTIGGHTMSRERRPDLLIIGAVDFSRALSDAAAALGFRVTVADHRPVFATAERFPSASAVLVARPGEAIAEVAPDERTVVCVMTHDHGSDVAAIEAALATPAGYIGAMGSRRAHDERTMALRDRGIGADALARVHSPIGLDLGGSTPAETAISILAEVIATRSGGTDNPLSRTEGPIHERAASLQTRSLDIGSS